MSKMYYLGSKHLEKMKIYLNTCLMEDQCFEIIVVNVPSKSDVSKNEKQKVCCVLGSKKTLIKITLLANVWF